MAFTLIAVFLFAWAMQRVLRLDSVTATLIGVGTAICGGSAIAATAPVIGAKEEDIARSISTIFLFNIAADDSRALGMLSPYSLHGFVAHPGGAGADSASECCGEHNIAGAVENIYDYTKKALAHGGGCKLILKLYDEIGCF